MFSGEGVYPSCDHACDVPTREDNSIARIVVNNDNLFIFMMFKQVFSDSDVKTRGLPKDTFFFKQHDAIIQVENRFAQALTNLQDIEDMVCAAP